MGSSVSGGRRLGAAWEGRDVGARPVRPGPAGAGAGPGPPRLTRWRVRAGPACVAASPTPPGRPLSRLRPAHLRAGRDPPLRRTASRSSRRRCPAALNAWALMPAIAAALTLAALVGLFLTALPWLSRSAPAAREPDRPPDLRAMTTAGRRALTDGDFHLAVQLRREVRPRPGPAAAPAVLSPGRSAALTWQRLVARRRPSSTACPGRSLEEDHRGGRLGPPRRQVKAGPRTRSPRRTVDARRRSRVSTTRPRQEERQRPAAATRRYRDRRRPAASPGLRGCEDFGRAGDRWRWAARSHLFSARLASIRPAEQAAIG